MTILFFGIGIFYIATTDTSSTNLSADDSSTSIGRNVGAITVCTLSSIIVSLLYIFLIKLFPKQMVYGMIFISLGLMGLLCVIGLATGNIAITIFFGILLLIYGIVLFVCRNKIRTGIALVKVATTFFSEKPIVFLTPVVKIVITVLFAVYWIWTIGLMFYKMNQKSANN